MACAVPRSTRISPELNDAQPQKAGRAARSKKSLFFMLFLLISVIQLQALHFIYYIIQLYPSRGFGEHMALKKIEKVIKAEGKPDIIIRLARVQDMRRIQMLYAEIYGSSYSVPIVTDKEKMRHAIEDNDYYWLVAECQDRVVGS